MQNIWRSSMGIWNNIILIRKDIEVPGGGVFTISTRTSLPKPATIFNNQYFLLNQVYLLSTDYFTFSLCII